MAIYEKFLQCESDPETLTRWGIYLFIIIRFFTASDTMLISVRQILDVTVLKANLDTNADMIQLLFPLKIWDFITNVAGFLPLLLFGIGALAFAKIAFNDDLDEWLRVISMAAVIVLVFGGFLF